MVNVNEFQVLLSDKDWNSIAHEIGDPFENLVFEIPQNNSSLLNSIINRKYELDHWKNEFNYKLISCSINYGYMYTYFKKLDGIDIYKEYDSEKIAYHFWFSYETESLLLRLFSLIDNLYHIINIYYDLKVPTNSKFRINIVKALAEINIELHNYLSQITKEPRYKKAQDIRNDFTHNHSPLNLTSGVKTTKKGFEISTGYYLKIEEAFKWINDFILLLKEVKQECEKHLI